MPEIENPIFELFLREVQHLPFPHLNLCLHASVTVVGPRENPQGRFCISSCSVWDRGLFPLTSLPHALVGGVPSNLAYCGKASPVWTFVISSFALELWFYGGTLYMFETILRQNCSLHDSPVLCSDVWGTQFVSFIDQRLWGECMVSGGGFRKLVILHYLLHCLWLTCFRFKCGLCWTLRHMV